MRDPALLVTGAAGTIGRALTLALAMDPEWARQRFVLTSTDPDQKLTGLRKQIQSLGHPVELIRLDIQDEAETGRFLSATLPGLAPFSGVALVAGGNIDKPLAQVAEAEWDRLWALNCSFNARLLIALAGPGHLAVGASLILVGSMVGARGNAGQAPYAASKGALLDILRLSPPGLRANLLYPPLVESPLLANLSPEARERLFATRLLTDPDPAASCAAHGAFLLSKRSSYIHHSAWHADSRISALGWEA